jgi:hypothetical protein
MGGAFEAVAGRAADAAGVADAAADMIGSGNRSTTPPHFENSTAPPNHIIAHRPRKTVHHRIDRPLLNDH